MAAELESSVSIGCHAFTKMTDDVDKQRLLGSRQTGDTATFQAITLEAQRKERYIIIPHSLL